MKKMILYSLLSAIVIGSSGCFMILAGAAAGAGTAYWLSEKLTQQVDAPYDRVVMATEKALTSLKMPILKEAKMAEVTQFKSTYAGSQDVWVDVRRVGDSSTKIEVRVGAVNGDKNASERVLREIRRHL